MLLQEDSAILTGARRAQEQVDTAQVIFDKLVSGLEIGKELDDKARELGLDIHAIDMKVKELYGDTSDDPFDGEEFLNELAQGDYPA